jgi:hypothetical protein
VSPFEYVLPMVSILIAPSSAGSGRSCGSLDAGRLPMRIELPRDLESALADAARLHGTTPDRLAEAFLRERLHVQPHGHPGPEPNTLADFLAGYIGVLGQDEPNSLDPGCAGDGSCSRSTDIPSR